ncbi:similar to Tigger transposable element-derived protein 6 [Ectocarpus siliculosus]|uniref:Similar to Tigger transposable element-derived protein 6 n=1 Tax=Ectocarpus siliculosus TaxID=2880 RepID=D7FXZ8_ECTSI|nr:similar to Tigger transposable element-derived protein 6 [Ectocarpus siliculosus]|eukprot:CBJ32411.1 similar to Tigger transposable element-derived protein 6 [Ectocarpus siliculosus]
MELNLDTKRTPTPVHEDLEARLNQWIKIARQRFEKTKLGLSGFMIQTQATRFASDMNVTDFTASKGWLHRFLGRYGCAHINLHGEAGDVDKSTDMGVLFALKCQYKTEMVMRLAALIEDWDTARARKIRRGCRGLSDAGQATMLDVTEILSQKWESFSDQTVVR